LVSVRKPITTSSNPPPSAAPIKIGKRSIAVAAC
jgi:hypothetical protein